MADMFSVDPTFNTLKAALDGLSLRQQVISQNLANVDTPGYQARQVSFEDSLKRALQKDDFSLVTTNPAHLTIQNVVAGPSVEARPGGSIRTDGNDVDIDVELTDMSETGIQYQAVSQAASQKLLLLKSIATG
jgi:flagellar basal-body rod protein FlgB